MKKIFISISCMATLFSGYSSLAQNKTFKELPPIVVSATSSNIAVSTKLNRAFLSFFKDASNLRWYEINKKFLVKFVQNNRENRALFTKNGTLIYHICYGSEQFLPYRVRDLVKRNYYDQVITRVLHVTQDKRSIWVIHMEDDSQYIMARVEDMELEETKRMTKSK